MMTEVNALPKGVQHLTANVTSGPVMPPSWLELDTQPTWIPHLNSNVKFLESVPYGHAFAIPFPGTLDDHVDEERLYQFGFSRGTAITPNGNVVEFRVDKKSRYMSRVMYRYTGGNLGLRVLGDRVILCTNKGLYQMFRRTNELDRAVLDESPSTASCGVVFDASSIEESELIERAVTYGRTTVTITQGLEITTTTDTPAGQAKSFRVTTPGKTKRDYSGMSVEMTFTGDLISWNSVDGGREDPTKMQVAEEHCRKYKRAIEMLYYRWLIPRLYDPNTIRGRRRMLQGVFQSGIVFSDE